MREQPPHSEKMRFFLEVVEKQCAQTKALTELTSDLLCPWTGNDFAQGSDCLRMLLFDLQKLGTNEHSRDDPVNMPPASIVLDSEAAMAMANSDRDAERTRHISRQFHCVRHGVSQKEHILTWVK